MAFQAKRKELHLAQHGNDTKLVISLRCKLKNVKHLEVKRYFITFAALSDESSAFDTSNRRKFYKNMRYKM